MRRTSKNCRRRRYHILLVRSLGPSALAQSFLCIFATSRDGRLALLCRPTCLCPSSNLFLPSSMCERPNKGFYYCQDDRDVGHFAQPTIFCRLAACFHLALYLGGVAQCIYGDVGTWMLCSSYMPAALVDSMYVLPLAPSLRCLVLSIWILSRWYCILPCRCVACPGKS